MKFNLGILKNTSDSSKTSNDCKILHMLILNMRTQWAFTHQMLHTLLFVNIVTLWVSDCRNVPRACTWLPWHNWLVISRNKDLYALKLNNADSELINLTASRLKLFWAATIKMLTIKLLNSSHHFMGLTGQHQKQPSHSSQLCHTQD
jgi:hypothetical protein